MAVLVNYLVHVPVNPPATDTSQETNEMIELCEPLQSAFCLSYLCFDVSPSVQMEPQIDCFNVFDLFSMKLSPVSGGLYFISWCML